MSTSVLSFTVLLLTAAFFIHDSRKRSKLPLPPGPSKLPIVGNLFEVPATSQWETFAKWSKKYNSDIIHLNLMGKSLIVLSSLEATNALLEKRSSIYSDSARDDFPMVNDLMGSDTALMKYGDEWRSHRRLFNQFGPRARNYAPHELLATQVLLKRILSTPDELLTHFRQMAGELIMSLTHGIDVLPSNDHYVTLEPQAIHAWTASLRVAPGLYLFDVFPILKQISTWLPLKLAVLDTKHQMESGIGSPSTDKHASDEEHRIQASTMFPGGADTTVSALGTFVFAMLANPKVQKRAQAEIDSVTGGQVLPTFEDRDSLPYVSALVKEIFRWKPVDPIVPHRLLVEEEYRGYRLPAGSLIIENTWALLHDETVYPDPHVFNPERFLLKDGRLNPTVRDPEFAFGYGRRQCPGRHMATASIWITVASILAVFDISKAVDADGRVIEPSYDYVSGLINTPLPFKCSIKPRSSQAAALVRADVSDAGCV